MVHSLTAYRHGLYLAVSAQAKYLVDTHHLPHAEKTRENGL